MLETDWQQFRKMCVYILGEMDGQKEYEYVRGFYTKKNAKPLEESPDRFSLSELGERL